MKGIEGIFAGIKVSEKNKFEKMSRQSCKTAGSGRPAGVGTLGCAALPGCTET